ncbi:MAG: nucleotidyl transferase AbiEii/AbiGii toxin family protein [Patescibacteria group bacterium]
MNKFYPEILSKNQLEVFKRLEFLKKINIYLAGGTALALQLGHRTSIDFDFYCRDPFDSKQLFFEIKRKFGDKAIKTLEEKDTMFCTVNNIELSFFWYKYPLIDDCQDLFGVELASVIDIAAMKMLAVYHRPVKRDYIDIFYLLKKYTLHEIFQFVNEKYPEFNYYITLRALSYFEDVDDKGKRPIEMTDKNFSWEDCKKHISEEVKKYQLSMFKK